MWKTLTLTGLLLLASVSAWAHGALWTNNQELRQVQKVVIFPFEGPCSYNGEGYLQDALSKRNKDTIFMIAPATKENPQALAKSMGADAYVITYIRENDVREDWSPEASLPYTYRYYQEETNGPHGTHRFDEHTYTDYYYVPGQNVYMRKVNLDFVMYNTQGEAILTMQDREYAYNASEKSLMEDILKEMAISWRDAKKEAKSPVAFQCEVQKVPDNVEEDAFLKNALDYTIEYESTRYKKLNPSSEYYVTANVNTYDESWSWSQPYLSTSDKLVSTRYHRWRDRDNNEHTATIREYETSVSSYPGHYNVSGKVSATLNLVDSKTNAVVYSYSNSANHTKEIDSYREIVRDFYKNVQKRLNQ